MRNLRIPLFFVLILAVTLIMGCGGGTSEQATSSLSMQTRSVGQVDFTNLSEYYKDPVIPESSNGYSPMVLAHNGQYYMWTNGIWGGAYLSTSADGVSWSPLTACNGLSPGVKRPCVIYNDQLGKFEIWYWNNGGMYHMSSFEHSTSSDGLEWAPPTPCGQYLAPHRPLYTIGGNSMGTYGPSQVFFNPSATATTPDYNDPWANRYVMFYDLLRQATSTEALAMAVSPDGITWGVVTEGAYVLGPGAAGQWDSRSVGFASIFRAGGAFHMYYGGSSTMNGSGQGIGYATSGNGLTWTKHGEALLHAQDGMPWRGWTTGSPCAVMVGDRPRLYFQGRLDAAYAAIGLALIDTTAPVVELQTPTPAMLWPANGQTVQVAIAGVLAEEESGLESATLQVEDEYGIVNQTINLVSRIDSANQFQVALPLIAERQGGDQDGRTYTITVSAADKAGNVASPTSVTVVCPHGNSGNGNKPPKK